ncbi:hypothetical protein DJ013_01445 [Arcticibacterium luteifluviistationis]|uniref:Uncharacterized protein n=2 Tax=Arcticibacterium luteifluviistationis TaxID=1784714 RepID=A0A2Z4G6Y2_9BACT|nr:hypothetical protein DJ013_01445 [Arcticibacterium luteifluviistationis]
MGNAILLLWAGLFWLLHVVKTSLFFHRTLKLTEYAFLQDFTLLPKSKQLFDLSILQLNLNAPFIAYSCFMVAVAIKEGAFLGIICVAMANLLLLVLPITLKYYRLHHFSFDFKIDALASSKSIFPNWSFLYFLRHLFQKQPILFFSTKLYGLFFIIGGSQLYFTDEYDERLLFICCLFTVAGQFPIGKEFGLFSANYMPFERNMPFKISNLFTQRIWTAISLIIIDSLFLGYYWYDKIDPIHLISSIIFIWSSMLFWLTYNYAPRAFEDAHLKRIYFGAIVIFLLIMFKVPVLSFGIVISVLSWWILKRNYFTFEFTTIDTK